MPNFLRLMATDLSFEEILEEKPTVGELCRHVGIGPKWYELGLQLKLYPYKLEGIRVLYGDEIYKTAKMFELWLDTNPYATRRQIIDALRNEIVKDNVIANEYEETLRKLCGKFELCEFFKNPFN